MIVLVNAENEPVEKIYFENATCISFEVDYTQRGESYTFTKMIVQTEKMIVGSGIDFKNHWIYDY